MYAQYMEMMMMMIQCQSCLYIPDCLYAWRSEGEGEGEVREPREGREEERTQRKEQREARKEGRKAARKAS